MVDQMQLIKSKTLPKRKPPVVKDKGKEKRIEEATSSWGPLSSERSEEKSSNGYRL